MKYTEEVKYNNHTFIIDVFDAQHIIPVRKTKFDGYTAFVTVKNENNEVTGGLPITNEELLITTYDSIEDAIQGAREYFGL
jgi:hypothetical protein